MYYKFLFHPFDKNGKKYCHALQIESETEKTIVESFETFWDIKVSKVSCEKYVWFGPHSTTIPSMNSIDHSVALQKAARVQISKVPFDEPQRNRS